MPPRNLENSRDRESDAPQQDIEGRVLDDADDDSATASLRALERRVDAIPQPSQFEALDTNQRAEAEPMIRELQRTVEGAEEAQANQPVGVERATQRPAQDSAGVRGFLRSLGQRETWENLGNALMEMLNNLVESIAGMFGLSVNAVRGVFDSGEDTEEIAAAREYEMDGNDAAIVNEPLDQAQMEGLDPLDERQREYREIFREACVAYGMPPNICTSIAFATIYKESSFRPDIVHRNGDATGLGQYLEEYWPDRVRENASIWMQHGISREQLFNGAEVNLDSRADARVAIFAIASSMRENYDLLASNHDYEEECERDDFNLLNGGWNDPKLAAKLYAVHNRGYRGGKGYVAFLETGDEKYLDDIPRSRWSERQERLAAYREHQRLANGYLHILTHTPV